MLATLGLALLLWLLAASAASLAISLAWPLLRRALAVADPTARERRAHGA